MRCAIASCHHPCDSLERALTAVPSTQLISQYLHFIFMAIRSGFYQDLFGSREAIKGLVYGVAVPNVGLRSTFAFINYVLIHQLNPRNRTEAEMGKFADTPLEFIRLDPALPGGTSADITTWYQAASAMMQALLESGYAAETEIVGDWIGAGLAAYHGTKGIGGSGWEAKDSLVFPSVLLQASHISV